MKNSRNLDEEQKKRGFFHIRNIPSDKEINFPLNSRQEEFIYCRDRISEHLITMTSISLEIVEEYNKACDNLFK